MPGFGEIFIMPEQKLVWILANAVEDKPRLKISSAILGDICKSYIFFTASSTFFNNRSLQQQFLLGLAIVTVLALIPFFGGLVVFLLSLFGLGVILLWKFGREKPQIVPG
ncbi:MAG: hypothetical protein WA949_12965 [Phormidesmis sp.]